MRSRQCITLCLTTRLPILRSFPEIADKKYDYTLKVILAFYDLGNADICFFR